MYLEFKTLALEDRSQKSRYGIECIFRFFSYGLESGLPASLKPTLETEFQELCVDDYEFSLVAYGLEKFWAYLEYREDKFTRDVVLIDRVKELFETRFTCMDDFRSVRPVVTYERRSSVSVRDRRGERRPSAVGYVSNGVGNGNRATKTETTASIPQTKTNGEANKAGERQVGTTGSDTDGAIKAVTNEPLVKN